MNIFWVSGLIFWVYEPIFWVSGPIFMCLDLYLGCLDLYFGCPDRRAGGRPGRVSETFGGQIHLGNMYPKKTEYSYIIEC